MPELFSPDFDHISYLLENGLDATTMDRLCFDWGIAKDSPDRFKQLAYLIKTNADQGIDWKAGVSYLEEPEDEDHEDHNGAQAMGIVFAPDLQNAEIAPVEYLIKDILPEGTTILSAASKIGKSWMVLDMGLCIAAGQPFMGKPTKRTGVLYMALEDSMGRLQSRMNKILDGKKAPDGIGFITNADTLDTGFLEKLDVTLKQNPQIKLVIIDTLQKIRGSAKPREGAYEQDYREMGMVKSFMDERKLSVLFVHHNRKMRDDADPFNMISGTNGIMGAADTIWTLIKEKRDSEEATLHVTGRDVEQLDNVIRFNKNTCRWENVGEVSEIQEQRLHDSYEQDPVVKTIKHLLETAPEHCWKGRAREILDAGKELLHKPIEASAQKLGYHIREVADLLYTFDDIAYESVANGSGGKKHLFYYQDDYINKL